MKLSKGSDCRRLYASCCGTPLAIQAGPLPWYLFYARNIETGEIPTKASICVRAQRDAQGDDLKIVKGAFAPMLVVTMLSRIVLLAFVGSYGPGTGLPSDCGPLGIGAASIA